MVDLTMCDTCKCNITDDNQHFLTENGEHSVTDDGHRAVVVMKNLLHENNHQAEHNRLSLSQRQIMVVNLMSSPGSGKTRLLETSIELLKSRGLGIAVIEGDLETENDADRIRKHNVPVTQITTGMACHLDAHMIEKAIQDLTLDNIDILFIENVGNLVCPASFDLGQHLNVVLLSVTEGDDKPSKYPVMFKSADNVIFTKTDLLAYFDDFSLIKARQAVTDLSQSSQIIEVSAKNGNGMENWINWLETSLANCRTNNQQHHAHD